LLKKLEACENIIELNIDGGRFNHERVKEAKESDRKKTIKYADQLVETIRERTWGKKLRITGYDNSVYGMDLSFGPYEHTKKFTWTEGTKTEENVQVQTFEEF